MLILRFVIVNTLVVVTAAAAAFYWYPSVDVISLGIGIIATTALVSGSLNAILMTRLRKTVDALDVGLSNLADNDFSVSLAPSDYNELRELVVKFNEATVLLGQRKRDLIQRELLLDRMLHSSPNLLLLVDYEGRVVFCNDAARRYFNDGLRCEGECVTELWSRRYLPFLTAYEARTKGLFTVHLEGEDNEGEVQSWHLDQVEVVVNQQTLNMVSFRHMTNEVNRQEVQTWKKVIRVVSHEINNSLGPMLSMINSGRKINSKLNNSQLSRVLDTLADRSDHLNQFVQGYAQFAKMPLPQLSVIDWPRLVEHISAATQARVEVQSTVEVEADAAQIEQAIINLCKNAIEAGSPPEDIVVRLSTSQGWQHIDVEDRGPGMSDDVIAQSLLPFYTTKPRGSGIGLALVREIVDAHSGSIRLQNRSDGGLAVRLSLGQKVSQLK